MKDEVGTNASKSSDGDNKRLVKHGGISAKLGKREGSIMANKNPYKRGNYEVLFAFMQSECKGIVTREALVAKAMTLLDRDGDKLSEDAANATVTVILSPRAEGREGARGDCRGNLSAQGHIYFVEPLAKKDGEDRKYRLRFRPTPLAKLTRNGEVSMEDIAARKAAKIAKREAKAAKLETEKATRLAKRNAKREAKEAKIAEAKAAKAAKKAAKLAKRNEAKEAAKVAKAAKKAAKLAKKQAAAEKAQAKKDAAKAKKQAAKEAKAAKAVKTPKVKVAKAPKAKVAKAPKAKKVKATTEAAPAVPAVATETAPATEAPATEAAPAVAETEAPAATSDTTVA